MALSRKDKLKLALKMLVYDAKVGIKNILARTRLRRRTPLPSPTINLQQSGHCQTSDIAPSAPRFSFEPLPRPDLNDVNQV